MNMPGRSRAPRRARSYAPAAATLGRRPETYPFAGLDGLLVPVSAAVAIIGRVLAVRLLGLRMPAHEAVLRAPADPDRESPELCAADRRRAIAMAAGFLWVAASR